jgi:hypothetical protein
LARHGPPEVVVKASEFNGPGLIDRREPEREVQTERRRHLILEEGTNPATVDTANQLTDQMPIEQC